MAVGGLWFRGLPASALRALRRVCAAGACSRRPAISSGGVVAGRLETGGTKGSAACGRRGTPFLGFPRTPFLTANYGMPLPGQTSQEACELRVGFTSLHYIWYYNGWAVQDVERGEKARMGNVVWENPLRRMEQAVDKVSRDYTRQIRWHKKHLRTVSAKLTVPEYELFRAMCTARHTTPYAVLCKMVRAYINMSVQGLQSRR